MAETPISRALRLARAKGMNQTEFAVEMGVLPQHVTNWKKRGMPPEHHRQAAKVVGITIDELLGETPPGRAPVNRPNDLSTAREVVTNVTGIPDPFSQDRFNALTAEQQQDIAQVLTNAFARYNTPPEGERPLWGSEHESVERRITRGKRSGQSQRAPKKKAG